MRRRGKSLCFILCPNSQKCEIQQLEIKQSHWQISYFYNERKMKENKIWRLHLVEFAKNHKEMSILIR